MTHTEWCAAMADIRARLKAATGPEKFELMQQSLELAKQAPGLQPSSELEEAVEEVKQLNQKLTLTPSILDLLKER